METIFIYNWVNIVSYMKLENWQYELISDNGGKYIVFEEEIIDNI